MHSDSNYDLTVLGLGTTGGRIVDIIAQNIQSSGIRFVAIDTDSSQLALIQHAEQILLAQDWQRGKSCGRNPTLGESVALHEIDKFRCILEHTRCTVGITTLSGGTGSGTALVLCKLSQHLKHSFLLIGITPYSFEGKGFTEIVDSVLKQIQSYRIPYILIPNELIFRIENQDQPLQRILQKTNQILAETLISFIVAITATDTIHPNLDFLIQILKQKDIQCGCTGMTFKNSIPLEQIAQELSSQPIFQNSESFPRAYTIFITITSHPQLPLKFLHEIKNHVCAVLPSPVKYYVNFGSHPNIPPDMIHLFILTIHPLCVHSTNHSQTGGNLVPYQSTTPSLYSSSPFLDAGILGIFTYSTPTIWKGENLDIPTFFRRKISIESLLDSFQHLHQSGKN